MKMLQLEQYNNNFYTSHSGLAQNGARITCPLKNSLGKA